MLFLAVIYFCAVYVDRSLENVLFLFFWHTDFK